MKTALTTIRIRNQTTETITTTNQKKTEKIPQAWKEKTVSKSQTNKT